MNKLLFYGGRLSLIPEKGSLFYQEGNEKRIELVIDALNNKFESTEKYGVHILHEPITHPEKGYIGGIIGRKTIAKLPDHDRNRFIVKQKPVYPHVYYFFLRDEQVFIIQKNHSVFHKPERVFEYIANYLNKRLFNIGISVFIQPLTNKGTFWKVLKESDYVTEIKLRFIVPNFLGEIYKDTKKLLEDIRGETGASQIEQTLIDQNGKLCVPEAEGYKAAIGWIEDGGGYWSIKAGKNVVTSKQSLTIFEKEITFEEITINELVQIIKEFDLKAHKIKRNKGGKDKDENI